MRLSGKGYSVIREQKELSSDSLKASHRSRFYNMLPTACGISSRRGMSLCDEPVIFDPTKYAGDHISFKLTGLSVSIDGRAAVIAVTTESDELTNIVYHICAVFSDGAVRDMGCITFTRTSDSVFAVPASFVMYSGTPVKGGGIFFLTRTVCDGQPDSYKIYEINSEFSGWTHISDSLCYVPTVLMNGQGENSSAAEMYSDISLSAPRTLEPLNMLCGGFKCRYTADGYSYSFILPKSGLDDKPVSCKMYTSPDDFVQWTVPGGSDSSDRAQINGSNVIMCCDRNSGRVFFKTESGTLFPLPFCGMENNLHFTAYVPNSDCALKVCSMSLSCSIGGRISSGSASVTVLSSSSLFPDEIIWFDPGKPLYFPESCSLTLREPTGSIEALIPLGGRLAVFKKDRIMTSSLNIPDRYELEAVLQGLSNSGKIAFASLCFASTAALPSQPAVQTIKIYGNDLFAYCKNGRIYRIDRSLGISELAELDGFVPELAVMYDGKYLLISKNRCAVCDPSCSHRLGLFIWELPANVSAAHSSGDDTVFFADDTDNGIYSFTLTGDRDEFMIRRGQDICAENRDICSSLSLLLCSPGSLCKLYGLSVDLSSSTAAELCLSDGGRTISTDLITDGRTRIKKHHYFSRLRAGLHFTGPSEIRELAISYAKCSKLSRFNKD